MIVSDEEVDAAKAAYLESPYTGGTVVFRTALREALEAAYRVRKERKKANREAKLKSRTIIDMDEMLRTHDEWDKQFFTLDLNLNEKTSP